MILVDASARFGWLTQIVSVIALGLVCMRTGVLNKRFWGGIALLGAVLTGALLLNVISEQKKVYAEDREILSALHKSSHGTIFKDILKPTGAEKLSTLALVEHGNWNGAFQIGCTNLVFPGREYAVVPAVLADFDGSGLVRIPGDVGMCDYKGQRLSPVVDHPAFDRRVDRIGTVWLSGIDEHGDTVVIWADAWPFRDCNGRQWLFYRSYLDLSNFVKLDFHETVD